MPSNPLPPHTTDRTSFTALDQDFLRSPPTYSEPPPSSLGARPPRPIRPLRLPALVTFALIAGVTSLVLALAGLRFLGSVLFH